MNTFAMKLAASTAIVSTTMVGCQSNFAVLTSGAAWAARSEPAKEAAKYNEEARRALREGDLAAAMKHIEQAVALSPRDAGYRLLLADIYLKTGRFDSAATTYGDVLEIDETNVRAGMTYALAQIALGRPGAAVARLDALFGHASPADLGLAYALAGYPERGIEILEPLARSLGATPRVRQNLALSYALAGDWKRAQVIASQDVSPADLPARMEQWASFARPRQSWDQVASLLGVTPVQDPGQPVRLALRKAPVAARYAEARVPETRAAQAPLQQASVSAANLSEAPLQVEAAPLRWAGSAAVPAAAVSLPDLPPLEFRPAPRAETEPEPQPARERVRIHYASAARALVEPEPELIRAAVSDVAPPAPLFESARSESSAPARRPRADRAGPGRYVVQLGAFSNAENAERSWVEAARRFGLRSEQPLTTTIDWDGRVLHRVSVAGFANRGEASRLCGSIQARGGDCFVREIAGDAPIRWAARYTRDA